MTEETTIRATVRSLDGDEALVEVELGGCGRCHEKGGCGGQQLTQMLCSGPKNYRVANPYGARVGDQVTVAITPGTVRKSPMIWAQFLVLCSASVVPFFIFAIGRI